MTEKIDLAAFRAGIATEVDAATLRQRQEAAELHSRSIISAECSPGGVILLLTIARLGTVFEGFPDSIPVGSPKDGITLARGADGVWHVQGKAHKVSMDGIYMRNTLLGNVCDAIEVDRSRGMSKLETIARIDPTDIGNVLLATRPFLPEHTFRSIVAVGKHIRELTGPGPDVIRDTLAALADAGVDVNASVGAFGAPLISTSISGDYEGIEALLASGADIDIRHNDRTALQHAVINGNTFAVETLLKHGASQKVLPPEVPLLHQAADLVTYTDIHNAETIIEHLLEAGADPTQVDDLGMNAEDRFRSSIETCRDMVKTGERKAERFDFEEMEKIASRLENAVNAHAANKI